MRNSSTLVPGAMEIQAAAPGRVNLIGEHTDYNDGFVLPMAIPQQTRVTLARNGSGTVSARSMTSASEPLTYQLGSEQSRQTWGDYIQGSTAILRREGYSVAGFDALVESNLPMGAGLSSSAALLVALFRGLRELFALPLTDVKIALLCRSVENDFVGAQVGIMDQMACSLADQDNALFLDTRSLKFERIPIPKAVMEFFVINSGISHRHADGDYNKRRLECVEACSRLGIRSLRDLTSDDLPLLSQLPAVLQRRSRHVITENARVLAAVEALRTGQTEKLGELFLASHQSMSTDYEVSIPEIDALVRLAKRTSGVFGARLTGGGFGGSIVGVAEVGKAGEAAQSIADDFDREFSAKANVLLPQATDL